MPRFIYHLLVLMLLTASSNAFAQQYNSIRIIGEMPSVGGAVTSIDFQASDTQAQLSFLDVAGLSTVYNLSFAPSQIISSEIPVYMPSSDFDAGSASSLDLAGVEFLTGQLSDPNNEDAILPSHWFRMTHHNNIWSGTFRVADRVYTINRDTEDPVLHVRAASSSSNFQASTQVKVSALIDDEYLQTYPGTQSGAEGQINALESLHVMEGLLADSLGLSVKLDQVIYRASSEIDLSGAAEWLNANGEAFGLTDNLAVFMFLGSAQQATTSSLIVQGAPFEYQFDSAHYLGQFLDLPEHDNTLTAANIEASVIAAHWNTDQRNFLEDNPPAAEFTRILSFDEPEIEIPAPVENAPIPQSILDSESVESNSGIGLQSDEASNTTIDNAASPDTAGGGQLGPGMLLMLLTGCIVLVRRQKRYNLR